MLPPSSPKKIVVVDDHISIRELIVKFLISPGNQSVVAQSCDHFSALEEIRRHQPHLVIVEVVVADGSGIGLLRQIRQVSPGTRMLVFSGDCSPDTIRLALEAGAHGYVSKAAPLAEFQQAVRVLDKGQVYFSSRVNEVILDIMHNKGAPDQTPAAPLSQRELGVLRLMATGLSTKEIAATLGISPFTVANHRAKIMNKTGLHRATQLSRYAVQIGLVPTPTIASAHPFPLPDSRLPYLSGASVRMT
ncbi:response regulator containing a CheY-like receiver domain and an HTH DNA-binding domain [Opitutaceae bacterium TAV1]|nr:response regulator containing a CheY-like receiver domain and an HTH DNA-binding domain [Opitutaceae bacterium TAV1]